MSKEFCQVEWNSQLEDDCRRIVRLAVLEDLGRTHDWTTLGLVPATAMGKARVVARRAGVIAGLRAADMALREMETSLNLSVLVADGTSVSANSAVAEIEGSVLARDMLTAERIILNILGRLSGVATLTHRFVSSIAGTSANIYDTRKTTPGWRRLEKYAVRCGGGKNHRSGLYEAVMIKDNHLAFAKRESLTPPQAVQEVRRFLREQLPADDAEAMIVEVEVDTVEQFRESLSVLPDIVLLDNMTCDQLRECIAQRNADAPQVQLEASGGVNLETVREIAMTGVDRISVGALTHSAECLDVGLDWEV